MKIEKIFAAIRNFNTHSNSMHYGRSDECKGMI